MKRKIYYFFLLFTPLIILSCSGKEEKESKEIKGIEVTTGNPVKKRMTEFVDLNANTVYQKQETVRATFQGFVEKSFKNIGDKITQGDLIFVIRTKEADAASNYDIKSDNHSFNGSIKIFARTSGVLIELTHQTGDYVSEGDQLGIISDPQSLKIVLDVPFQYVQYISNKNSFSVQLPDGKEITAQVFNRMPSIDPINQTQKYILETKSGNNLPANLNVSVKIPVKSFGETIALPKSSVMSNETQSEFWVMKLINDSLAVKLHIQKGIEADGFIQIKEPPIDLKDRFIIEGAYGLPDTAHVLIQKQHE